MHSSSEEIYPTNSTAEIDLTNCDREPIHVPGAIQPHGVLLSLDEVDLRVVQVSVNCAEFLGVSSTDVLGNTLTWVLGDAQANSFRETLSGGDLHASNPMKLSVGRNGKERIVNGICHRYQGVLFLELEPVGVPIDAPLRSFQRVQTTLAKLQKTSNFAQLWRVVVQELRTILGYDRVMIYKFDRSGNGEVIEEEVTEGREQYLGLHYPASDIPQQARLLYSLNPIRHIPDVGYKPAELIPLIYPLTRDLTDLSYSTLRSVSPIHIEYLQNMGVAASLSISLMSGSSLWGLIACHNYSPKFVPFELRAACELLGQVVSLQMVALVSSEQTNYKATTNVLQARFLETLAITRDMKAALITSTPNLLDYLPAGGCALIVGNECLTIGATPSAEQIARLVRRVRRFASPVFATDDLRSALPESADYKEVASGVLGLTISREKNIYLFWFRPEQVQTVKWGGNPNKSVDQDSELRLRPRKSFSLWKEVVSNKSLPWTESEIQAATELRSTMMGMFLHWGAKPSSPD